MSKRIYLASPHMSDEGYELEYIKEAFDTNWIAPLGANVNGFEDELARYVGAKDAAALVSGTSAIHLALKAANVEKGDIVFCSSFTFAATANPIIYQGATPVFIDSDYKTWNMCPVALEEAFKKYPDVKAIIVVHLYGFSADMDEIISICRKNNVTIIEDAAESLGSLYKGRYTGTLGDYGVYSFNGNKIITTSGGGMLVSNDSERIGKVRFWATQSRDNYRYYHHTELGYNYRMSNVVAGIGRGQLKVLGDRVRMKKKIYNKYKEAFKNLTGVSMIPKNEWDEPNYWISCILLNKKEYVDRIIESLEAHNIESRMLWKPMHLQPFYEKYAFIGGGVSTDLFQRGLCLPSDTKMTDEDLLKVIKIVREIVKEGS